MLIRSDVSVQNTLIFDMVFEPDIRVDEDKEMKKKVKVCIGDEVLVKYVDKDSRLKKVRGLIKDITYDPHKNPPKNSKIITIDSSELYNGSVIKISTDHIVDIIKVPGKSKNIVVEGYVYVTPLVENLEDGDEVILDGLGYVVGYTAFSRLEDVVDVYRLSEPGDLGDSKYQSIRIHIDNMTTILRDNITIRKNGVHIIGKGVDNSEIYGNIIFDNVYNCFLRDIFISENNNGTDNGISPITFIGKNSMVDFLNCDIVVYSKSSTPCINATNADMSYFTLDGVRCINEFYNKGTSDTPINSLLFKNVENISIKNCKFIGSNISFLYDTRNVFIRDNEFDMLYNEADCVINFCGKLIDDIKISNNRINGTNINSIIKLGCADENNLIPADCSEINKFLFVYNELCLNGTFVDCISDQNIPLGLPDNSDKFLFSYNIIKCTKTTVYWYNKMGLTIGDGNIVPTLIDGPQNDTEVVEPENGETTEDDTGDITTGEGTGNDDSNSSDEGAVNGSGETNQDDITEPEEEPSDNNGGNTPSDTTEGETNTDASTEGATDITEPEGEEEITDPEENKSAESEGVIEEGEENNV